MGIVAYSKVTLLKLSLDRLPAQIGKILYNFQYIKFNEIVLILIKLFKWYHFCQMMRVYIRA